MLNNWVCSFLDEVPVQLTLSVQTLLALSNLNVMKDSETLMKNNALVCFVCSFYLLFFYII